MLRFPVAFRFLSNDSSRRLAELVIVMRKPESLLIFRSQTQHVFNFADNGGHCIFLLWKVHTGTRAATTRTLAFSHLQSCGSFETLLGIYGSPSLVLVLA